MGMKNLEPQFEPARSLAVARQQDIAVGQGSYAELNPSYYAFDPTEDSQSTGLLEYWRIFRLHKGRVLAFTACGALLGVLIGLPQKPVYRVSTSVEILNLNENFLNMKQANPVSSNDESFDVSEEETQVKLLQSDALLARVANKLDPDYPQTAHKPRVEPPIWQNWFDFQASSRTPIREKLLGKLASSLKVRATPRTRVIELTAKSTDPQLAVEFANTLTNEYIEENIEARWKNTQKVGDWLTRELNDERANLRTSEDALQTYARNSGLIFTDETTNVATEKLQQLQVQLTAVTGDRISKQSRYELAQHSPPDSLPDLLNDTNLRESAAKVTDLRRQIADLSAVFTSDYSKLKRLNGELAATDAAFQRDRANIVERIKNDYQEALRKEQLLASAYVSQTREVTGQDEKAIQYNILKREVESHRQLYDTMLQQMKQSSIATALHASNVRVVDPAELPEKPIWPNFPILSGLGLLSGLLLGLVTVVLQERADRSLQQPGEMQLWTKRPELGIIPSASVDRKKTFLSTGVSAAGLPAARKAVSQNGGGSVELTSWQKKPSLLAEAFRSTLTSILFIDENGTRPKVLVLTSANASDGKTTIVSNLGVAIAESRRKVLIIDADLRRPRVHQVFDLPNERGLSDLLAGETVSDESIKRLIRKTTFAGVDVLTSGPATLAAANLLYSPHLAELIEICKQQYDMVLIDTPPMLQMTDARVVGRLADAVVLVARAEQTTRDAIIAASQRFAEDRIRVLGTILNDWNPKRSHAGQYGYYGYSRSNAYASAEGTPQRQHS